MVFVDVFWPGDSDVPSYAVPMGTAEPFIGTDATA